MLYADYNYCSLDNITYTIDMIRIRCDITNFVWSKLEYYINTVYKSFVKSSYVSTGISDFHYNYNIEIEEGKSFWFGFIHNSELVNNNSSLQNDNAKYNFTLEFNPNKLKIKGLLFYIIRMCLQNFPHIKSVDIAMDIPFNILDIGGFDKGRKKDFRMFSQGGENKTYYIGRTNNRVKIYNKKIESNLDKELTRIEITSKLDLDLLTYTQFNYNVELPKLYLNNYLLTFDDIEDKTLLAIVYAVQNGFPLNDLSRRYRDKVEKKLFEGGQLIPLSNNMCTQAIKRCIQGIFYPNTIKESL